MNKSFASCSTVFNSGTQSAEPCKNKANNTGLWPDLCGECEDMKKDSYNGDEDFSDDVCQGVICD